MSREIQWISNILHWNVHWPHSILLNYYVFTRCAFVLLHIFIKHVCTKYRHIAGTREEKNNQRQQESETVLFNFVWVTLSLITYFHLSRQLSIVESKIIFFAGQASKSPMLFYIFLWTMNNDLISEIHSVVYASNLNNVSIFNELVCSV